MSQITIFNTTFFDDEANIGGNGISLQMESFFHIKNSSFIALNTRNLGPVLINNKK